MSRPERQLEPGRSSLHRFGYELRKWRKARGLSQGGAGALVHVSGALLHQIEIGERRPARDLAVSCDKAFRAGGALIAAWDAYSEAEAAGTLGEYDGVSMTAGFPLRYCERCGTRLAGDNRDTACGACQRQQAGSLMASRPPQVPADFWQADLVRDPLAERHMGHFLRAYREHPFHGQRGISQEAMSRWLHLSQTQLSRIENGPSVNDLVRLTDWARLFRIPSALLWFDIGEQQVAGPDLAAEFASDDSEDLAGVLDRIQKLHRGIVHPEVIRQLDASVRSTVAQYEKLDHSTIVPAFLRQRALVNAFLGECHPAKQQRQLYEIAGAMSGVLGYIAVGRGDFRLARAYTLEAFQLGDFAENASLQAWARGLQSFCEYYSGRYDDALSLAEDGLNYAQSGPQSVRLAANGVARARGKLGDAEGVDRAVSEAYDLMSCNDVPEGMPSSISFECYSAAQTASNAATAYVSLGKADKVQRYVDLAMPDISNSDSPWSRSLVMIDLALSHVWAKNPKEADLDRAAELILTALSISADRPIVSVLQRTSEFIRDARDRWGSAPQIRKVLTAAETLKIH